MRSRVPFAERGGTLRGLLDLATGCYPAFLFGGSLSGVLPVFHFHEVTREWLSPRLQYLAENGYRTVTCDEIARLVVNGVDPGPRAVALTFDDAWASVWTVAAPLLREYSLTAILFAIPDRVPEADTIRPSACAIGATGHESGPLFVTWPELRALHTSGIVDVQSHTRSHAMIFSDDTLTGFVTPDYAGEPLLARPLASVDDALRFVEPDALGTPLYQRRSRMSDARRFVADERVGDRCRDYVRQHGGAAFFGRATWRQELREIAADSPGAFETETAQASAILAELALGRALLNERLGTTSVRHVALPWGIAGERTRRAVAETGHETAFAERPLRRRGVHAGDDRFQLMRLNGKFLTCLPGRRRQWFFTTV
jgi:polysaccharide deacetylase